MVRMRNMLTHTDMYVAEDRVEEYKAMGHTLALGDVEPIKQPKEEPEPIKEPVKKLEETIAKTKKTTRKRV